MTNRANHRPSSTWASLCIYQIDFPVYISARLHGTRFRTDWRNDAVPRDEQAHAPRRSRCMGRTNCEMSAEAARRDRSRVLVYS